MTQDTKNQITWLTGIAMSVAIIVLGLKVDRLDRQFKHEIQSTAIICTLPGGTGGIA